MKKYFIDNSDIRFIELPNKDLVLDKIPNKVFLVKKTQTGDLFLTETSDLRVESELYGDVEKRLERVKTSFLNRDSNLGILLHGVSGTGKSMLARVISSNFMKTLEMPVIIVNESSIYSLGVLLEKLTHSCVIFIDEFEKLFDNEKDQSFLLPLLDGVTNSKHLFILTANNTNHINDYFFNRPGRILYSWEYKSLEVDVIKQFLEKNLEDKSKENEILNVLTQARELTFDILKAFVNEVNLFKDYSIKEIADGFNISMGLYYDLNSRYDMNLLINKEIIEDFAETKQKYVIDHFMSNVYLRDVLQDKFVALGELEFRDKNDKDSEQPLFSLELCCADIKSYKSTYDKIELELSFDEKEIDRIVSKYKEFVLDEDDVNKFESGLRKGNIVLQFTLSTPKESKFLF